VTQAEKDFIALLMEAAFQDGLKAGLYLAEEARAQRDTPSPQQLWLNCDALKTLNGLK
jgi:hypothetical protein